MKDNNSPDKVLAMAEAAQDPANQGDILAPSPVEPPPADRPYHEPGVCMGADVCPDPFHRWFGEEDLPKS